MRTLLHCLGKRTELFETEQHGYRIANCREGPIGLHLLADCQLELSTLSTILLQVAVVRLAHRRVCRGSQ